MENLALVVITMVLVLSVFAAFFLMPSRYRLKMNMLEPVVAYVSGSSAFHNITGDMEKQIGNMKKWMMMLDVSPLVFMFVFWILDRMKINQNIAAAIVTIAIMTALFITNYFFRVNEYEISMTLKRLQGAYYLMYRAMCSPVSYAVSNPAFSEEKMGELEQIYKGNPKGEKQLLIYRENLKKLGKKILPEYKDREDI